MESRVFSSEAFASYASDHLVLIKADFPRQPQDAEIKRQNQKLAETYGVEGFPTVLLLSSGGEVLSRTVGARYTTPEGFLEMVREAVKAS